MTGTTPRVIGLAGAEDLRQAATLYRQVFGYSDSTQELNPRLLTSLRSNGGSVVGARNDDGELVGFAYGFPGVDGGVLYHYSQAAVVRSDYQGGGLGRALKLAQAEIALETGAHTMRWSFDPVLARNAHFNLNTLAAVGRWFHRDFYGPPDTDRLIVEWDLDKTSEGAGRRQGGPIPDAVREAAGDAAGWGSIHTGAGAVGTPTHRVAGGDSAWIPLPASPSRLSAQNPATGAAGPAAVLRGRLGTSIDTLLSMGYVAISCQRVGDDAAVYEFVSSR